VEFSYTASSKWLFAVSASALSNVERTIGQLEWQTAVAAWRYEVTSVYRIYIYIWLAVATEAASVARSLKLRHVDLGQFLDG